MQLEKNQHSNKDTVPSKKPHAARHYAEVSNTLINHPHRNQRKRERMGLTDYTHSEAEDTEAQKGYMGHY